MGVVSEALGPGGGECSKLLQQQRFLLTAFSGGS